MFDSYVSTFQTTEISFENEGEYRWNPERGRWEFNTPFAFVSFGRAASSWQPCRTVKSGKTLKLYRPDNARHLAYNGLSLKWELVPFKFRLDQAFEEALNASRTVFGTDQKSLAVPALCVEPCCGFCKVHSCAPCVCGCE
jgi:hypothetical protein